MEGGEARDSVQRPGRIAFSSDHGGSADIYIMDSEGVLLSRLTDGDLPHGFPTWSPDGASIAYVTFHNDSTWSIDRVAADGSGTTRLAGAPGQRYFFPDWSPDGESIVFGSRKGDTGEIWVMAADGTNPRRLGVVEGAGAVWSPDGTRIAYYGPSLETGDIYVMDVTGGASHVLVASDSSDITPAWSPDGGKIAFSSRRDGGLELYVLDLATGEVRRVTFNDHDDWIGGWSPDGSTLVFDANVNGDWGVRTIGVDGTNERELTSFPGHENQGDWGRSPLQPSRPWASSLSLGADSPSRIPRSAPRGRPS